MTEEKRIPKLIVKASDIDSSSLSDIDDLFSCYDCNSNLFYFKLRYGIVAEEHEYMTVGNKSNRSYQLRETGLNTFCAECGAFNENYWKNFYPEDRVIMFDMDIFDKDEMAEIENCLMQFNEHRDFKSRYNSNIFKELKEKLLEYEKKHPEKNKDNSKRKKGNKSKK